VPVILAAQTAGGALGSIISPAKVIVGCSTVGLNGKEGQVLGKLLFYGSIPIFLVAFFTFVIL
jgi:lactate permease